MDKIKESHYVIISQAVHAMQKCYQIFRANTSSLFASIYFQIDNLYNHYMKRK